ncbi:MAG: hypothetical protein ABL933_09850 [Methyloglobulus sp.]|nr:hypothetical protein [Methyloglobulus sp.]
MPKGRPLPEPRGWEWYNIRQLAAKVSLNPVECTIAAIWLGRETGFA